MAVCCLLPWVCIRPINAGLALSVCHADMVGTMDAHSPKVHTASRNAGSVHTAAPALRCADPKFFLFHISPHYRGYAANFVTIPMVLP